MGNIGATPRQQLASSPSPVQKLKTVVLAQMDEDVLFLDIGATGTLQPNGAMPSGMKFKAEILEAWAQSNRAYNQIKLVKTAGEPRNKDQPSRRPKRVNGLTFPSKSSSSPQRELIWQTSCLQSRTPCKSKLGTP